MLGQGFGATSGVSREVWQKCLKNLIVVLEKSRMYSRRDAVPYKTECSLA